MGFYSAGLLEVGEKKYRKTSLGLRCIQKKTSSLLWCECNPVGESGRVVGKKQI